MNVEVTCLIDRLELVDLGISLSRLGKVILTHERARRSLHLQRAINVGAVKVEPVNNRQQPPPNYRKIKPASPKQGAPRVSELDVTPIVTVLQKIHQEICLLRKEVEDHGNQLDYIRTVIDNYDPSDQTTALVTAIKSGLGGMMVRPDKLASSSFSEDPEEMFIPTKIIQGSDLNADISLSSQVSEDSDLDDITAALKAARKMRK